MEIDFGAEAGPFWVEKFLELLVRHIQLWRVFAQLIQVFAGANPTCIRLPLALGGVVHVIRHARDLAVMVQLL
ncbi:hypothetical protein ATB53_20225 [Xanthomonas translucens]|uniref:Uncharacterized protein n=2 Tax=Xanthomonas campestris pv. translucens TaxID=343 RepID=A0A109HEN1_XANCT|nr:hypothetical protein ATB53_20225 [Xanthomonas translucens]